MPKEEVPKKGESVAERDIQFLEDAVVSLEFVASVLRRARNSIGDGKSCGNAREYLEDTQRSFYKTIQDTDTPDEDRAHFQRHSQMVDCIKNYLIATKEGS